MSSHDPDAVRKLKTEVDALARPLAKAPPNNPRDVYRGKARASLEKATATLMANGMSLRGIAAHLGCDVHTLHDWIHGNRQVPAWVLHALPRDGRVAYVRAVIDSIPPDSDSQLKIA